MRVLLYEYKKSLRITRKAKTNENDRPVINGMINDLEFAIDWIERGREPGKRRGADKTKVYLKDPFVMDSSNKYLSQSTECQDELSSEDKIRIQQSMSSLTERERETFILFHVECLTYQEISELFGIKKDTVKTTLKRARIKIEKAKGVGNQ